MEHLLISLNAENVIENSKILILEYFERSSLNSVSKVKLWSLWIWTNMYELQQEICNVNMIQE